MGIRIWEVEAAVDTSWSYSERITLLLVGKEVALAQLLAAQPQPPAGARRPLPLRGESEARSPGRVRWRAFSSRGAGWNAFLWAAPACLPAAVPLTASRSGWDHWRRILKVVNFIVASSQPHPFRPPFLFSEVTWQLSEPFVSWSRRPPSEQSAEPFRIHPALLRLPLVLP